MLYAIDVSDALQPHLQREWLLTNGLGGFAASSVVGCNTRRYHGLLCAATMPPVGRIMALNRMGESVRLDSDPHHPMDLSVNQFGGVFHPRGDRLLTLWEMEDLVRWTYQAGPVRVVKELQVPWLKNAVGLRYRIDAPKGTSGELRLQPFVSLRDFHATLHAGAHFDVSADGQRLAMSRDGHTLHLRIDNGTIHRQDEWWYDHTYAIETERGLDDREDLFSPGFFTLRFDGPTVVTIWGWIDGDESLDWDAELDRRREAVTQAQESPSVSIPSSTGVSDTVHKLTRAANDFVVRRRTPDGRNGTSIVAGYPWFADWGRDTFISLPGLLLTTGRFEQAKQVLSVFAQYISEGMIPNKFDDYSNEPHYNTVDASLWFIHTAFAYRDLSQDRRTFDDILLPGCRSIFEGYKQGTRYHIRMDPADGLITQGDENTQLTWMDARHGGISFTPRQGKAIEINALWYHALMLLEETDLADRVAESVRSTFWINPFRGLADVVNDAGRDEAIRPNQIFAVSLPHSPLTPEQQSAVVAVVQRELLTPVGLRTLAASDPGYWGRYGGPQAQRDAVYHNGTVWAWPMGAFLEAYLKVHNRTPQAVDQVRQWLMPLIDHLNHDACIGQISEIFEGDPPHRPVGCCAQAWSVAEVLRLAVEVGL